MFLHATCHGGHQFGHWAGQLGDGNAINLGEMQGASGQYLTLRLKGAGRTPYFRTADGLAVLRSSVREFLCSEAMHHLGVPTARALGLITTRQTVMRDMFFDGNTKAEAGAVIWRVAPSLTRSVDFEIVTVRGEIELPRRLVDYTSRADFPHLSAPASPATYVEWFAEVCRRYRFGHQPRIAYWNLAQLANAVNPLINEVELQQAALRVYTETFARQRGLEAYRPVTDDDLMTELLFLLYSVETDMTLFYRRLALIGPYLVGAHDTALLAPLQDTYYTPEQIRSTVSAWRAGSDNNSRAVPATA